jgi:F-type H+-transporting ATPase subunit b
MIKKKLVLLFIILFTKNINAAEGGMPQLNPESFSSQIFWLSIFFFVLFLINHFLFLPKLEEIRSKRDKTIADYLNEAKSINDSVNIIIQKMSEDLEKTKEEQNFILKEAFKKNKMQFEDKIKNINDEFEKKKDSLNKSIEKNENTILSNLPSICVSLSDNLYEKIMGERNKGSIKEFKEVAGNDSS